MPGEERQPRAVAPELVEELEAAFAAFMRRIAAEFSREPETGLTVSQYLILKRLQAAGPMTMSGLAEAMGVTHPAATALVGRMLRAGFVTRRWRARDRRQVWVALTPRGREALEEARAKRDRLLAQYLGATEPGDVRALVGMLRVLAGPPPEEREDRAGRPAGAVDA